MQTQQLRAVCGRVVRLGALDCAVVLVGGGCGCGRLTATAGRADWAGLRSEIEVEIEGLDHQSLRCGCGPAAYLGFGGMIFVVVVVGVGVVLVAQDRVNGEARVEWLHGVCSGGEWW